MMASIDLPLDTLPRVTVAGRFALADRGFATTYRGPTHALHLHDYHGRMRLAGDEIQLVPGDITVSPAGGASGYDLDQPGRHWCVHFSAKAGEGARFGLPLHLPTRAEIASAARERMAEIAALHARTGERLAQAGAALALQQLLLWLADGLAPREGPAEQVARLIDAHFAEPIDSAAIARMAGRSQAHLARAFRARFGTTIPHHLLQRRAAHARYLLESTDLPIWRVAERVGIPDAQHFNKTIRRLLGASPSAIRAASRAALVDPDR